MINVIHGNKITFIVIVIVIVIFYVPTIEEGLYSTNTLFLE